MTSVLFNKEQNELFEKQLQDFKAEVGIWKLLNVRIPVIIIMLPLLFVSFLPESKVGIQNLLLNGSFSLLGINVLFGMSTLLINSVKMKDQKFEKQIIDLRIRLMVYLCCLLLLGTFIYVSQVASDIGLDTVGRLITISIALLFTLVFSLGVGLRIYLIKDELIGKSYSEDVSDSVRYLKNNVDDIE